jgi:ComF family protein
MNRASHLCPGCLQHTLPFGHAWAAFRYESPVAQQIQGLKFHARLAPAHVLGELMAVRLAARTQPLPEMLIPVPLHARRLQRRGYNQALEIARVLSRRLSIPLGVRVAGRLRATPEQSRLTATQRRRNLRDAFRVSPAVKGRHVALLDDVITTGATVTELARTAREAGADRIEVWAVARTA